jgi:hypothetical protein
MPVIGFLDPRSPDTTAGRLRAFRQGLKEAGFVEGENVANEYRWAEGQYSFKRSQMADYLSAMAPVSTNALSWLGESGYALARYRAFLTHARKPSSHDQQSPQHGV